jgi:hypothetical protein
MNESENAIDRSPRTRAVAKGVVPSRLSRNSAQLIDGSAQAGAKPMRDILKKILRVG